MCSDWKGRGMWLHPLAKLPPLPLKKKKSWHSNRTILSKKKIIECLLKSNGQDHLLSLPPLPELCCQMSPLSRSRADVISSSSSSSSGPDTGELHDLLSPVSLAPWLHICSPCTQHSVSYEMMCFSTFFRDNQTPRHRLMKKGRNIYCSDLLEHSNALNKNEAEY